MSAPGNRLCRLLTRARTSLSLPRRATRRAGHEVTWLDAAESAGAVPGCALPDARSELESAARWALAQLLARPGSELLIIVPGSRTAPRGSSSGIFSGTLTPARCAIETPSSGRPSDWKAARR